MPRSLPLGWAVEQVLTLGRLSRAGGKTFAIGRRSQLHGVRLPDGQWASFVVNELGDVRLYRGLPGPAEELPLRFLRQGRAVRTGYSATGMPDHFHYLTALPRPRNPRNPRNGASDAALFDLLMCDYRSRTLDLARQSAEGGPFAFDWPTQLMPLHGVPAAIDWRRDGDFDLLLGRPDGSLHLLHRTTETDDLRFDPASEPVIGGETPIELPGPIFPCVIDWRGRGRSDLILGTGAGEVFFYEDVGDDDQVQYARPRRLRNERGFLQFKGPACPTIIEDRGKRLLLIADGEGVVWSCPIQKTDSFVTSDLRAAFGEDAAKIATSYVKGSWRLQQEDGRTVLAAAPPPDLVTGVPAGWDEPAAVKPNKPAEYDPPAPDLTLRPPLPGAGVYEIHVTLLQPASVHQKAMLEVRLSDETTHTVLGGGELHTRPRQEVYFRTADLSNRSLVLKQMVGSLWATGGLPVFIESIRLLPVKKAPAPRPRKKRVPIGGISDAVDWTMWIKTDTPELVDDFVAKHQGAGINVLYHKLGGGCWEYPSKVPGAKSVVPPPEVEGLPPMDEQDRRNTQRRIEIQESLNWVQLTADACHRRGMTCIGWMRIQNHGERLHGKGPLDEFYVNHPQYREQNLDGTYVPGKLCLAYREVRDFHLALCEEAIELGCDGILMDTVRHLPKALHADPICARFEQKYGQNMREQPPFDPRVLEVQNEVFTGFLREVRQAIQRRKPDAVLHVRVCKPYAAYGCDPQTWAREGIVDEIIIEERSNLHAPDIEGLVAATRSTACDAGAVFCRTHWAKERMPLHPCRIETEVARYLRAGAASITFYETAGVVDNPEFARAIRRINDGAELPSRMF